MVFMTRQFVTALLLCAATALSARAQRSTFEVATIKRNVSVGDNASTRALPGGRITVTNLTLFNIVRNIYRLQAFQIVGGPEWIHTDRWDIVAKAEGEAQCRDPSTVPAHAPEAIAIVCDCVAKGPQAVIHRARFLGDLRSRHDAFLTPADPTHGHGVVAGSPWRGPCDELPYPMGNAQVPLTR